MGCVVRQNGRNHHKINPFTLSKLGLRAGKYSLRDGKALNKSRVLHVVIGINVVPTDYMSSRYA